MAQFGGAGASQLDLQNAASFPYSTNALNAAFALNNQLAAAASNNQLANVTNASQQLANANSYYAALASQAITATGNPSLAAYQQ